MPSPPGWQWVELRQIARLESGHTPSRRHPDYWDGGIPWIGIKDARKHHGKQITGTIQTVSKKGLDNSAARLLPPRTVCLSRTASVGYALVMGKSMATSQDFVNWVCSEAIEPEFLMQLFIAEGESLRRFGSGTTHTTIYYPEVKAFHVCVPPVNEQRRVVLALDTQFSRLDAAVASLERALANLKRYRASVLQAAVGGRLVPTEAEIARRENRDYEPASALLERILRERRCRWEEAELARLRAKGKEPKNDRWKAKYKEPVAPDTAGLPKLPEGWCWASVDAVGDVLLGRRRAPEYVGAARPYLRVANVRDDHLDLRVIKEMSFSDTELEKYMLQPGDVLVSEGQSPEMIGQSAVYRGAPPRVAFQSTLHRYRAFDAGPVVEFAQLVFRSHVASGVFRRLATITTNIAHLVRRNFVRSPFPLAPLAEQTRIVEEAERLLSLEVAMVREVQATARRIASLRQSILAWAFQGRLVDQDPSDEPASVLLERIRRLRESESAKKPRRGRKRKKTS